MAYVLEIILTFSSIEWMCSNIHHAPKYGVLKRKAPSIRVTGQRAEHEIEGLLVQFTEGSNVGGTSEESQESRIITLMSFLN